MMRRLSHLLFVLLLCLAAPAWAEGFDSAEKGLDKRLEQALGELAQVRARITDERVPLSRAVSNLERQVHSLSQEQSRLVKVKDGLHLLVDELGADDRLGIVRYSDDVEELVALGIPVRPPNVVELECLDRLGRVLCRLDGRLTTCHEDVHLETDQLGREAG